MDAVLNHHPAPAPPKPRRRLAWRRAATLAALFLVLGAILTLAVAWSLAAVIDPTEITPVQFVQVTGDESWTLNRWDRAGGVLIDSVREVGFPWSPSQATGAPDTPYPGDQRTAWASATTDAQPEWLLLEYDQAVVPREVAVYETYCPGALAKVGILDESGKEVIAWEGTDPSPTGSPRATPISKVPVNVGFKTRKVKLYIDSPEVPGWNEIDAVGLIADDGSCQWAQTAQASSWFNSTSYLATGSSGSGIPGSAVTGWGRLSTPEKAYENREVRKEERAVQATGWPMLAFWGEKDPATLASRTGTVLLSGFTFTSRASLSLAGGSTFTATPPPAAKSPLPFHPIWGGLLVNAALYGALLWAAWWALRTPTRFLAEVGRMRRGCCLNCGYDLRYDFPHGCPECGWRRH